MKIKMFFVTLLALWLGWGITCSGQGRVWEFSVKLSSETSASNYVRVFLDSDVPDLAASLRGFYVRVGHDQKQLCLFRKNGTKDSLMIAGTPNRLSAGVLSRFKVERSAAGEWQLFSDYTCSGTYVKEGQSVVAAALFGGNSGVVKVCSLLESLASVHDQLLVERLPVASPPAYVPVKHDVLISEVMSDPDPVVGLPAYEYVELFNRTSQDISLAGWTIKVDAEVKTLPSVVVRAGSYLVLTHTAGVASFPDSISALGVFTSANSIADEAADLALMLPSGDTIDRVRYALSLHTVASKKNGGWSLERDSLSKPLVSVWHSSAQNQGGTPGEPNSVAPVLPVIPDTPAKPYIAKLNDVVINEVMADPDPVVGLPAYEYVELYNRTDSLVSLTNWTFTLGNLVKTIPACTLQPKGYLLLTCAEAKALFEPFGQTVTVFTSKTSLPNDGQALILQNASGTTISSITYTASWYANTNKDDGGWSMELKNPLVISVGATNWLASADLTGGTPGRRNSNTAAPVEPGVENKFIFSMASDVFSPNQDGYQDQMEAFYRCEKAGYSVEAAVYNTLGQRLKWLKQSEQVGMEGVISWDGKNDSGVQMPVGAYILHVRFYHSDGTVREYKWPCVLAVTQ